MPPPSHPLESASVPPRGSVVRGTGTGTGTGTGGIGMDIGDIGIGGANTTRTGTGTGARKRTGSVLPEGPADRRYGLDVTDVPPRAIFGVLLEEAARRIQAADGLDDLGGDVGLLQLARGGAEVARLVGGDEGA